MAISHSPTWEVERRSSPTCVVMGDWKWLKRNSSMPGAETLDFITTVRRIVKELEAEPGDQVASDDAGCVTYGRVYSTTCSICPRSSLPLLHELLEDLQVSGGLGLGGEVVGG